ncbi:uncharacterized protein LOC143914888 isoform X2 [Arctopsyche grandis]|uniref:uncharacterized protein LOC143914888 isoform X2 n=1 Tax=Arctopsyche grandis TaxID=121162 RepID=UPI00406D9A71
MMKPIIISTLESPLDKTYRLEQENSIKIEENEIVNDKILGDGQIFPSEDGNVYFLIESTVADREESEEICIKQIEDEKIDSDCVEKEGLTKNTYLKENSDDCNYEVDINSIADIIEAFKCKFCNFTTLSRSFLTEHCKEVHLDESVLNVPSLTSIEEKEQITYICGKCSIPFASLEACHDHMIEDHHFKTITHKNEIKPYLYEKCVEKKKQNIIDKYWLVPRTYKEVRIRLQADRKIKCTYRYCVYKFDSIDAMMTHKSCHIKPISSESSNYKKIPQRDSPSYVCTICQKIFINWPNCSLHFWRAHSISLDLLLCPLCSVLRTHSVAKMIQHLARHWQKNQNENCGTCKTETMEIDDGTLILPRWYAKKKCEICHKMFSNSKSLKKHIQAVHKKIKPFTCNVCSHSSSSKHTMQLHIRQHTGEKPYSCDSCEYRTGDHNTLRKHRMKHTGERPYKCPYCPYASIQSMPLKHHLKSAHPDKPSPDCPHKKSEETGMTAIAVSV